MRGIPLYSILLSKVLRSCTNKRCFGIESICDMHVYGCVFHLTLTTLLKSFSPCYLLNVKREQIDACKLESIQAYGTYLTRNLTRIYARVQI